MFKSSPPPLVPLIEAVKSHPLVTSFQTMRKQCHSACVLSAFLCYLGAGFVGQPLLLSRDSFVEHSMWTVMCLWVVTRPGYEVMGADVASLVWRGSEGLCLRGWPVLVGNVNATCERSFAVSFFFPKLFVAYTTLNSVV